MEDIFLFNRKPVVKQLKEIMKLGYVANRGKELYNEFKLDFNCLFHACFNLTNKQLKNFNMDFDEFLIFYPFGNFGDESLDQTKNEIFKFIKDCGLNIFPDRGRPILKNQHRIALYFSQAYERGTGRKDFHFLLQERDGTWSSKQGSSEVEFNLTLEKRIPFDLSNPYLLDGTYIISNPYANSRSQEKRSSYFILNHSKENSRYARQLTSR